MVMHNPLTYEAYEGELNKEKLILSAGRLTDWRYKGWDTLVYSWARIANKYPDWKFTDKRGRDTNEEQRRINVVKRFLSLYYKGK